MFGKSMRKAFLIVGAVIILLISLAFGGSLLLARGSMRENAWSYLQMTHQQVTENIERYLADVENIGFSMCYSPSVQNYLMEADPTKRYTLFSDVQTVFSNLYYMDNAISSFSIYDANGDFLTANGSAYPLINMRGHIDISSEPQYTTEYTTNANISKSTSAYIMTLPVVEMKSETPSRHIIGALVFSVNTTFIKDQVNAGNLYRGSIIQLVDSAGRPIATSSTTALDPGASEPVTAMETTLNTIGWRLITSYQTDVLSADMQSILGYILFACLIMLLLSLCLLWIISREFIKPIEDVSHFMRNVSQSSEATQYEPKRIHYAELTVMMQSMNQMITALNEKNTALLEQEKRAYEFELSNEQLEILAYRSQINPHFLYNTLECIGGMAMMHGTDEIAKISQALSNMFRYAVKGDHRVTVREELAHMHEYSIIIHYRFMDRISIHLDAQPEALGAVIPRLVLQPVLENAVFHGLEKRTGKGTVTVTVTVDGNTLRMVVADDGLGMTSEQLETIRNRIASASGARCKMDDTSKSIGLWNIAHRLYLFYQGKSTFKVTSAPMRGTTVEIHLPLDDERVKNVPANYRR